MEKVYDYIVVGSGFGGSVASLRLSEKGKRFNPDDFPKSNWEKLLKPFYETAALMMGRTLYEKINPEDRYLREVAKDMNRSDSFENVSVGVYMDDREEERDPYFNGQGPLRKPCIECAGCMVGCRENAKNSLDKNYLCFAETRVVRIECNHTQYIVYTRSSTRLFRRKARKFRNTLCGFQYPGKNE